MVDWFRSASQHSLHLPRGFCSVQSFGLGGACVCGLAGRGGLVKMHSRERGVGSAGVGRRERGRRESHSRESGRRESGRLRPLALCREAGFPAADDKEPVCLRVSEMPCMQLHWVLIVFSKFRNFFFLSRGKTDKRGEKICEMLKGFILLFSSVLMTGL